MMRDDRQIDPEAEFSEKRAAIEAQGGYLPTYDEDVYWTRGAAKRLKAAGENLPPCHLDPEGPGCNSADHGQCPAACRVACNRHRYDFLPEAKRLLKAAPGPIQSVTLIDPSWRRQPGNLASFDLKRAMQLVRNRLAKNGIKGVVGVGSLEVSYNIDAKGGIRRKDLTPHVHFVAAGSSGVDLRRALAPPKGHPRLHGLIPLVVKEVRDLDRELIYVTKAIPNMRVGTVKLKLPPVRQLEYERFALRHRVSELFLLFGARRYGRRLVPLT